MRVKTSDGVSLQATVQGAGPALLLIHGACVDSSFFGGCLPLLARNRLVVSYDRRGYGGSSCPDELERSIAVQADDALSVMRSFPGVAAWSIVAHSFGCLIAAELASRKPGLVGAAVMHEPAVFDCLPEGDAAIGVLAEALDEVEKGDGWLWSLLSIFSLEQIGRGGSVPLSRARAELQEANMRNFILMEAREACRYAPDYGRLRRVACTVCTGRESVGTYHNRSDSEFARRIGARHLMLAGGHNLAVENPSEFASSVEDILAETFRSRG